MAEKQKLTKSWVEGAKPRDERRRVVYDTLVPGFFLRIEPTGAKSYYFTYRKGGGRSGTKRTPKIGAHGAITLDEARGIARGWAAEVVKGGDPSKARQEARKEPRMSELFQRYIDEYANREKKASSAAMDAATIQNHLATHFGGMKVSEVEPEDVKRFHAKMAGTPVMANRCIALLSKAFGLAEEWKMRPQNSNPCHRLRKYPEEPRRRFLTASELGRLGDALRKAERGEARVKKAGSTAQGSPISPHAIAAIRLLLLTGMRRGEVLGLRWEWVDFEGRRVNLPDSKSGWKSVPLSAPALDLLATVPRVEDNPHVIVGAKPGAHLVNIKDPWMAIRAAAGLEDVHIHDLRHSFAAVGAGGGQGLYVIGKLLGHKQAQTTERYAHLADDPLRAAADAIGGKVAAAMEAHDENGGPVSWSGKKQ